MHMINQFVKIMVEGFAWKADIYSTGEVIPWFKATTVHRQVYKTTQLDPKIRNVVVEYLTLLLRVREVPRSNLGQETNYPNSFAVFLSHSRQMMR
jgi:hypothetical protein